MLTCSKDNLLYKWYSNQTKVKQSYLWSSYWDNTLICAISFLLHYVPHFLFYRFPWPFMYNSIRISASFDRILALLSPWRTTRFQICFEIFLYFRLFFTCPFYSCDWLTIFLFLLLFINFIKIVIIMLIIWKIKVLTINYLIYINLRPLLTGHLYNTI